MNPQRFNLANAKKHISNSKSGSPDIDTACDSTAELVIIQCLDFLDDSDLKEIEIQADALEKSFYTSCSAVAEENRLGCKHYKTNCKFMAECCKRWFPCRFCHNEASDHEVDRYKTKFCICMNCSTVQRAGKICINSACGKDLSFYYCNQCKFWDDDSNKKIFHCDKCGVCRNGLRENYVHCDKCNACLATEYHESHKCIERSLECDCPICGEFLFTTTSPIIFMPCGHGIHFLCHRDHLQSSYQCPICMKSVTDMSHFFNQIDMMLANHQMPPEYEKIKSIILCNDCEKKSTSSFHFVYHKCGFCKSYNTKLLKTFNEDEMDICEADANEDSNSTDPNMEANSPYLD
jgi:hypothetical protein